MFNLRPHSIQLTWNFANGRKIPFGPGPCFCSHISVSLADILHVSRILTDGTFLVESCLRQMQLGNSSGRGLHECECLATRMSLREVLDVLLEAKQVFSEVWFHLGTVLQMAHYGFVLSASLCVRRPHWMRPLISAGVRCALPFGIQSIALVSVGMNMYVAYENLWGQWWSYRSKHVLPQNGVLPWPQRSLRQHQVVFRTLSTFRNLKCFWITWQI